MSKSKLRRGQSRQKALPFAIGAKGSGYFAPIVDVKGRILVWRFPWFMAVPDDMFRGRVSSPRQGRYLSWLGCAAYVLF